MKVNIFNIVLLGFFFFSLAATATKQPIVSTQQKVSIYKSLTSDLVKPCSFPPKDIQSFDFIKLCNELTTPADNANVESDEVGFLCMGFYDISLRLCGEEKINQSSYIFEKFSDLNATIYSLMRQENISVVEGEVNRTKFCEKMPVMNTTYSQTMKHMMILNAALGNQKYCEHLCFTFTGRLNPLCGIMFWGNNMLLRTHQDESRHENEEKYTIKSKDKSKDGVNDVSQGHANEENNKDNKIGKPQSQVKSAPVSTGQNIEHKAESKSAENGNKESNGSLEPPSNSAHSSNIAENTNIRKNTQTNSSSGSNNENTPAQNSKPNESKSKTGTETHTSNLEQYDTRDDDGENGIFSNNSTPIETTPEGDNDGGVSLDQEDGEESQQQQPSNQNKQGKFQIVTNDPVLSKNNKGIAPDDNENRSQLNKEGDSTKNIGIDNMEGIQARGADGFSQTEDSHFFLYFSSMIVMCTIMYILFHNKNKILALALEGRKHRPRPPKKDGYVKVDNLEEAMASPLNKSVTNIIY